MTTTKTAAQLETARAALAAHDDPSIVLIGADGFPLIGSVERAEYIIEALRPLVDDDNGDDERECDRCGDDVQTLSSQDLCDGCVEEDAAGPHCIECGQKVDESDGHSGYGMCAECLHNALRSGWNPGDK